MWFGDGRSVVAAPINWSVHSFTVDAWFKFYDAVGGDIIETTSPQPYYYRIRFTGPNTVTFTVNGGSVSTTFTFVPLTDYNKWFIVQVSAARQSETESNLCVKMNDEPIVCSLQTAVYDDWSTGIRQNVQMIGAGLSGYIRKIKIYDYPKTEPSMELMYKTSPQ